MEDQLQDLMQPVQRQRTLKETGESEAAGVTKCLNGGQEASKINQDLRPVERKLESFALSCAVEMSRSMRQQHELSRS